VRVEITVVSQDAPAPPAAPSEAAARPGVFLTPVPSASAGLETARRLETEGNLEGAAQAYIATAATRDNDRSEATLGAARVLLELDRPADVRTLLEPFVANATGREVAARYMLARAYAALEQWDLALREYDAYIASGRPARPYAYLDRARVLVEIEQLSTAATSAATGLNLGVPGSARRAFRLAIAQAYERAGTFTEAMRWYNLFAEGSELPGDDALALSRIAAIKRAQGDPSYAADIRTLLATYPATTQALNELTLALERGDAVDATTRGLIYYRNNDYVKAEPAFRAQISAAPDASASAEAYYYLAAILEYKGDYDGADASYAKSAALNPASTIADDALWWRARLLEDDGDLDAARPLYGRIIDEYPHSTWAADAAFRRGMLAYGAKKYKDAADVWAGGLAATTSPAERQRLGFWRAKALLKDGSRDTARPILEGLAQESEDDYYGIRALGLLNNKNGLPKAAREAKADLAQQLDFAAAEAWLRARSGRAITDAAWSGDYRWLRAQELWLVGRSSQGDGEAFDLIEAHAQDPIAMYTLSRELQAEGRIGMSARAGQRLLRTLNTNPNGGVPRALLSLSYPPAFGAGVTKYAQDERISPLLLLAFIRQESFFDPRAESPAGALGLTQVLPTTAKALADKLNAGTADRERLLQADLNLRLGARYMADQLARFDNEVFVAFAAYNAGPGGAQRWRKTSGDDADLFLEVIEFAETRLYVEIVAENYAMYRYIYAGEEAPNLP
jgi:soluble lytic murein transglycosylase